MPRNTPDHVAGGTRPTQVRRIFGSHLSVAGGLHNAIDTAVSLKMDTVQIFVKNQRQWNAPPLRDEDRDAWLDAFTRSGLEPAVAHASYLINLASADDALWTKSRDALAGELARCTALRIPGLVLHPGAAGEQPVETALARVAEALDSVYAAHPSLKTETWLEATAGQGTTLGREFRELGEIIRRSRCADRLGVCIDTCHVFAAGYDIRSGRGYGEMIAESAGEVGLERVRCWHLNDSLGELGSRRDRHEHIGQGRIGLAGFRNVLLDERFALTPMILETPKGEDDQGRDLDTLNLARLRRILRDRAAGKA